MPTYYVDPAGDNSDPGTEAQPWQTVSYAATAVAAGDTVIYEDGTYDLGEAVSSWTSGTPGNIITHQARNSRQAIWEQTSYGGTYAVTLVSVDYVTLDGILIRQDTITNKNRTVSIDGCDNIELTDVEITHCTNHCMMIRGGSTNITVDGCEIHSEDSAGVSSGKDGIHIYQQNNANLVIKNTNIYHTQHDGVGNSLTSVANCDVTIQNCHIYDVDSHCVSLNDIDAIVEYNQLGGGGTWPLDDNDSNGVRLLDNVDAVVRFNDIYGCSGRALWVSVTSGTVDFIHNSCYGNNYNPLLDDQGSVQFRADGVSTASITFRNNIIYHTVNNRRCLVAESGAEGAITAMDYNIWYDSSGYDFMRRNGTTYSSIADYLAVFEPNSIEGDPLFNDAGGDDFTLQAGSPAIDAGLDLGYPYSGTAPDIGAHERVGVVPAYVTATVTALAVITVTVVDVN